jgi:CHAT domain-containing protein
VPHDLLHYVPFHALHDGREYVIDSHTVSYAPSAAIYRLCCQRPVAETGPSLVMGVPDERAPSILDEVEAVADLLPDPILRIGEAATAASLAEHGSTSRIVHIATHGYFREDNPLFSGIRLGDSYLTSYDLYSLRLPAELLTVSGCGTGLNVVTDGDELSGLIRGLFSAGARSLLVSLWDVHDRSTTEFMKAFYRSFGAGLNKGRSLQEAVVAVREAYPHPYYWGPFMLVGAAN